MMLLLYHLKNQDGHIDNTVTTLYTKKKEVGELKAPRVRSGLRVPSELNNKLIIMAENEGISKNALMLRVLGEWVKDNDLKRFNTYRKE